MLVRLLAWYANTDEATTRSYTMPTDKTPTEDNTNTFEFLQITLSALEAEKIEAEARKFGMVTEDYALTLLTTYSNS
jgi:hypothetical protein